MNSETFQARMRSELADRQLFEQAKSYAPAYMDQLDGRSVLPDPETILRC
jgi:hypothetical protein